MRFSFGFLLASFGLSLFACREPDTSTPEPAETSPNARITPAPLLSGKSRLSRSVPTAAAAPGVPSAIASVAPSAPQPYPLGSSPEAEVPIEETVQGLQLEAEFTWPGRMRPVPLHGLTLEGASELRASLSRSVSIDLATVDRMRVVLTSNGFPFPEDTALLSRRDREGHLLLWPDETTFRIVPPSALRALFRERRLDVTPTLVASVDTVKKGTRFELITETMRVQTAHGELELEQGNVEGLGSGGYLVCTFLLEFIAASSESVCRDDTVPLRAHYRFTPPGELVFSVKTLKRGDESPVVPVAVPPSGARFVRSGLPSRNVGLIDPSLRAAMRPESTDPTATLNLQNPGPLGGYVLIDDTPIAYLEPGRTERLEGFRRGDYQFSSLTWFGEALMPGAALKVPGRFVAGHSLTPGDAGAP
jgi:hypothetical protein